VVLHAGGALDHLGDPLQGPEIVRVPMGCRTFSQLGLDRLELFTRDLRPSPGTSGSAEPSAATPSPALRQSETI
jgi:hypothetical protein